MRKSRSWILMLQASILIASCAPLKRSQVRLIGNYFNTIAEHPAHIQDLRDEQADLVLEADNLKSALFASDSLRIASLMSAIHDYEVNLTFPDSILTEIAYFENYIRGYYLLAPNGFNIYRALKTSSVSVVGVFGLGSVANSVIPDGEIEVSAAKKSKIHEQFFSSGDRLGECLRKIKEHIDLSVIPTIDQTNERIRKDIQKLFVDGQSQVSSIDHYFNYNRFFIGYFEKLSATRRLALNISESLDQIILTEKEIKRMTQERQKIRKDSPMLHALADDIEQIRILLGEAAQDHDAGF